MERTASVGARTRCQQGRSGVGAALPFSAVVATGPGEQWTPRYGLERAWITDAGHAASHRGYRPPREHLETILDTIENLLHRKFVLQLATVEIRAATPARK